MDSIVDKLAESALENPSHRIWFNIPEPIDSFCGREDFLSQIHDQLKPRDDSETEITVLSQVKIVSGLGGIGKTETARKYIMKHRKFYSNFIWIDAETENSMKNSFLKLAEEIKIPFKNSEGKPREIQEILKEIYNKICFGGKSNLIVFDNAEDYESCKKFFPFGLHPDLTKPVILATSRNQDWISQTGKIQVLPLDKMTDDESLEFILKLLEIPESDAEEFIELIGGLPLALQQAVAFIKHQKEANKRRNRRPYKLSDYVKEFKSSSKKLQNFPHAPDSSTTVFITWNLTLNKIKDDPKGKIAIEIIELMSFLYADKVPVEFLLQLLPLPPPSRNVFQQQPGKFQRKDLLKGLKLLEKFSMIKITGEFVSIHRQVQFVILQNLKSSGRLENIFNHLTEKCFVVLKNLKLSECSDIFLNAHQIANDSFDLIPVSEGFLDFLNEFGRVLWRASRYSESLELYRKSYRKSLELLGENHEKILTPQHQIALQLHALGRLDEALSLYEEVLEKHENHPDLGTDHPNTITTKHHIAALLREQGKNSESLELFQQVLDQTIKIHGENHPSTLGTQNSIAVLLLNCGHLPAALTLFEHVEQKQIEILGPDHRDVLVTKHNKATVLFRLGKLEEAKKILNENFEKRKEILGENHLDTNATLSWIGVILEKEGELAEALDVFTKAYEIVKLNLGEDHSETIIRKNWIMRVEQKIREQNEIK